MKNDLLLEIITLLQQLHESAAVDIPAYLRRALLKWLREHS